MSNNSKPTANGARRENVVDLRHVWKIFGDRAQEAYAAIQKHNLSKAEVLDRFECVVGVRDVNISVNEGEVFCIMGLSGSGKSTLVRHVNRLIEPTAGEIYINGVDVNKLDKEELRAMRADNIGMVFQNMALLPHRSVRDNVTFALELRGVPKDIRDKEAERVIDIVSLQGYGDRMPSELSGGMQQRVGLARALAADPDILLMDEPFSALDPLIRRGLQDEFLELSKKMNKTTLFITHDLDEAIRMGSRIAIMKDGEIVQIGTPEDIVTKPADEYVAQFVAGISKLKLVYAHTVMMPLEKFEKSAGKLTALDGYPQAGPDDDLDTLVGLAVDQTNPVVIVDDGKPIGIVTKDSLLHGIQGEV